MSTPSTVNTPQASHRNDHPFMKPVLRSIRGEPKERRKPFLGFRQRSHFYLWATLGGIFFVFSLSHLRYLSTERLRNKLAPGEWFWYRHKFYQYGMKLHLGAVLPAGALCVFQFIPILRNKYRALHRWLGRIIYSLVYIGIIGALMITRHSFGGTTWIRTGSVSNSIYVGFSMYKSWTAIRNKRVVDHRAWALRAMVSMSSIVTMRVLMIAMSLILNHIGSYYTMYPCDELEFTMQQHPFDNQTTSTFTTKYPACLPFSNASAPAVPVKASFRALEEAASSIRLSSGSGMWLAILIHTAGTEYYLRKTSVKKLAEADRRSTGQHD